MNWFKRLFYGSGPPLIEYDPDEEARKALNDSLLLLKAEHFEVLRAVRAEYDKYYEIRGQVAKLRSEVAMFDGTTKAKMQAQLDAARATNKQLLAALRDAYHRAEDEAIKRNLAVHLRTEMR